MLCVRVGTKIPHAANKKYKVTVTTGAKNLAGLSLDQNPGFSGNQPKSWTFITGLLRNIYRAVIRPLRNASTMLSNTRCPSLSPFPTYHPEGTGFSTR